MSIHDNATAILGKSRSFEGLGANPMPKSQQVLSYDDFHDGGLNGWRPVHFDGDVPWNPVSVESDFPAPGLFMATSSDPRRSGAVANGAATFKGMSHRIAQTGGIISFAGKFYLQSGSDKAYAFSSWGIQLDIQNWNSTIRAHPTLTFAAGSGENRPQWQIANDSQVAQNITGLTNPITGSTVTSTASVTAGMNEAKWDENYIRLSLDLGNMFTTSDPAACTARYYECNINGYRFDLRGQGAGRGAESPQASTVLRYFDGGLNVGINMFRSVDATVLHPARLVATELTTTYHGQGWLA